MASRKIEDLIPELQALYYRFQQKMIEAGLTFSVTCTLRSQDEQIALYSQGRDSIETVHQRRKEASLPPITEEQNKKVTWTLKSKHIEGKAFDIVLLKNNQPIWDIKVNVNKNEIPDYQEAGLIGESVGLKWGGRFKNKATNKPTPDYPHFEL